MQLSAGARFDISLAATGLTPCLSINSRVIATASGMSFLAYQYTIVRLDTPKNAAASCCVNSNLWRSSLNLCAFMCLHIVYKFSSFKSNSCSFKIQCRYNNALFDPLRVRLNATGITLEGTCQAHLPVLPSLRRLLSAFYEGNKMAKPRSTERTQSVFISELDWHLKGPVIEEDGTISAPTTPYYMAKQRAIDYYRRYTAREITVSCHDESEMATEGLKYEESTPDAIELSEGNFLDANLTPENRTIFNDLVRKLLCDFCNQGSKKFDKDIALIFVAAQIRKGNLEHILDEDLQTLVAKILGDKSPETELEVSETCGFPRRSGSRASNDWTKQRAHIQDGLHRYLVKTR